MRVLDLFSGIGGFSLGLERAGMRTVAFCEIDPHCATVLGAHWPHVPVFRDVTSLTASRGFADVICGGFPCQDISVANVVGKGIAGSRSGLWSHYARLIDEIRPLYVIVENVAALLDRGIGKVLGDLAEIGYDAEWHCIPASAIGAPHRRDRIWIVAYPSGKGWKGFEPRDGILGRAVEALAKHGDTFADSRRALDGDFDGLRIGDGLSVAMERRRLHGLGNAVVPQIPEIIGRAIMNLHHS
jgi:DNA (cytosine-5)-methyltransferase 1